MIVVVVEDPNESATGDFLEVVSVDEGAKGVFPLVVFVVDIVFAATVVVVVVDAAEVAVDVAVVVGLVTLPAN